MLCRLIVLLVFREIAHAWEEAGGELWEIAEWQSAVTEAVCVPTRTVGDSRAIEDKLIALAKQALRSLAEADRGA